MSCVLSLVCLSSFAKDEHLLDGISMDQYYYQTGDGVRFEIYGGKIKYKWITGARKVRGNQDLPYKSRKIGEQLYLLSQLEAAHPDYITLVFNFKNRVVYSFGLARFGTDKQMIVFEGGIVEGLKLVEE